MKFPIYVLALCFIIVIGADLAAATKWQLRKEYRELSYDGLVEKCIDLSIKTNEQARSIKVLTRKVNKPFKVIKFWIIFAVVILIIGVIAYIALKIIFKIL